MLGHLLAAGSLADCGTAKRDEQLARALALAPRGAAASAEEGARVLAAEVGARRPRRAARSDLLAGLPRASTGTHALRLKLQAARAGRQPRGR